MNVREALKACLDGKKIVTPVGHVVECRLTERDLVFFSNGEPWSCFPAGEYSLYVKPEKEITYSEAWAALGEGKIIRIGEWLHCFDSGFFRAAPHNHPRAWRDVTFRPLPGTLFYLYEGP